MDAAGAVGRGSGGGGSVARPGRFFPTLMFGTATVLLGLTMVGLPLAYFTYRAAVYSAGLRNYKYCIRVLVWTGLSLALGWVWALVRAVTSGNESALAITTFLALLVGAPLLAALVALTDRTTWLAFVEQDHPRCCPYCNFDVRNVAGTRCTECGKLIPPEVFHYHARRKFDDRQRAINAAIEEPQQQPHGE